MYNKVRSISIDGFKTDYIQLQDLEGGQDDIWFIVDDKFLSKKIVNYRNFTPGAQQKEKHKWLKRHADIEMEISVSSDLPNASRKIHLPNGRVLSNSRENLSKGVEGFLKIIDLFETPKTGCYIAAAILTGFHAAAIRERVPSLRVWICCSSDNQTLKDIFKEISKAVVLKTRWEKHKYKIHRKRVLDYQRYLREDRLEAGFSDFSRVKIQGIQGIRIPIPYTNTFALVMNANAGQVREATPYLENAAAIFLNCGRAEPAPLRLTSNDLSGFHPDVLAQFKQTAPYISAMLRQWWEAFDSDKSECEWAKEMECRARAAFTISDKRIVRLEIESQAMRLQLLYQVLLYFIERSVFCGLLSEENAAHYQSVAQQVFAPESPISKPTAILRQANAPDVFLAIMRKLAADHSDSIVPEGQECVKHKNFFGAWRTISDVRYLVMEEDAWAQWFSKEVKHMKEVVSPKLDSGNQRSAFLRPLGESALIKKSGDNPRYRYDLFKNGTREKTYVVAIPADSLQVPAA